MIKGINTYKDLVMDPKTQLIQNCSGSTLQIVFVHKTEGDTKGNVCRFSIYKAAIGVSRQNDA
jgi:hypothetical protein